MVFRHSNAPLDHFLGSHETRNDASCHLFDKLEGGRRQVSPCGSVGVEGVIDQPLVQRGVLLVAKNCFLGNVLHDAEAPSRASIPPRILPLRQYLSLNLVHGKRQAQAVGHLLQADDPGYLLDIGHAFHQLVTLETVDGADRDEDFAARALNVGDVHDLRESPICRLLLVGIQVLPQTTPASGFPGLLRHSSGPVPVEAIAGSLEFKRDLLFFREVLVVDVLDLRHIANAVGPRQVAARCRSPLSVVELALLLGLRHERFQHRGPDNALLGLFPILLDAVLVVPSDVDVHPVGPDKLCTFSVIGVDEDLVRDPILCHQGFPVSGCVQPTSQLDQHLHIDGDVDGLVSTRTPRLPAMPVPRRHYRQVGVTTQVLPVSHSARKDAHVDDVKEILHVARVVGDFGQRLSACVPGRTPFFACSMV